LQSTAEQGFRKVLDEEPDVTANAWLAALGDYYIIYRGIETRDNSKYLSDRKRDDLDQPILQATDTDRYYTQWGGTYVRFVPRELKSNADIKMYLVPEKVLLRRTGDELIASLEKEGYLVSKNLYLLLPRGESSAAYLCALLNSKVMDWQRRRRTRDTGQAFAQLKGTDVTSLQMRSIAFTTPADRRDAAFEEASELYERCLSERSHECVLSFVEHHLSQQPDEADIVHDLLAYLAERMTALNKEKQAEQERFFGWLKTSLAIRPDREWNASLDSLRGKSALRNYLGDYQKGEPELTYERLYDILHDNRTRLGVSLSDARFTMRLREEYEASLSKLRPIKSQLAFTDSLIDQVVYRLYGLTEEEIAVVEGSGKAKSDKQ
jgi:hypothetical protein